MTTRALAMLGVEPSEQRSVALMTTHAFFMGCSTVFFETAVSAFFLSRFDAKFLPWVYVAAAAVNLVTGTIYSHIQERLSFAALMKGTLWFLILSIAGIRVGLAITSAAWLVFGGLVWYRVISILTDLEYWAVAARVYDVRQAKRLFGLIGTGEVVARIAGAFSVPLLVKLAGVGNLLWLSAGSIVACLVLLTSVLRGASIASAAAAASAPPQKKDEGPKARASFKEIAASPYLKLVVGTAVLATFGKYFVDFSFLEELSTRSTSKEELASFLGIFSGATQVLGLLTRVFISRPLLHRFGIRLGLLMLPAFHVLCTVGIVATGFLGLQTGMIFWFVIANQGVYDTLKHPIDNPSFKVLYQPLKPEQRLAAQIAVETVFSPMVLGVAGAIMLLFSAGMHYDPVKFGCVMLVNFVAWTLLARAAGRGYTRALLDMLKRRIEGNAPLDLVDASTVEVLRERLESSSPAEVVFALHLLERSGIEEIVALLAARLSHASPEVRRYVVGRLIELQPDALRPMRSRLSIDPAASVRGPALAGLAQSAGDGATRELLPHLEDADPTVVRAVVAALFDLEVDEARSAATARIEQLSRSESRRDRRLAATLAGEHALVDVLRRLLDDGSPVVRRAALTAMGDSNDEPLRARLFDALTDPRFAETAMAALTKQGEAILPEVDRRLSAAMEPLALARLARVCARIHGEKAIETLRAHLDVPDAMVRSAILAALDALGYRAKDGAIEQVRALLRDEAREAVWCLSVLRDLDGERDLEALREALEDEVFRARKRIFRLLAMMYDRTTIHRARAHVGHASKDKRAYALEVFDVTIDSGERELLLPLLDEAAPSDRLARVAGEHAQPSHAPDRRLAELVSRSDRWIFGWTRALSIRAAVERSLDGLVPALAELTCKDPIVAATAEWARAHLREPDKARELAPMLLIEKILILKTVQMFADTSEELLAEIASIVEEVERKAGETIFSKGDVGDSMYIVVTGRVRVFDGETTIRELGEKELFGELALLDPEPRSASVATMEDTRLFRLDDDTFSQLMAGNLEIVRGVLHVLCERLRRTSALATGAAPVE